MSLGKTEQIVRRPTSADIDFLVENAREEDVAEVKAMHGMTVREALEETADIHKNAWVWELNHKIMCIFGVNPVPTQPEMGVIWMLGSKFFDDNYMIFASACKPIFEDLVKGFSYVFNYVHDENVKSIKWLKWLGFKVNDAEPIGLNGAKFHRFEMWDTKCAIQ